jgi:hypothetical protein
VKFELWRHNVMEIDRLRISSCFNRCALVHNSKFKGLRSPIHVKIGLTVPSDSPIGSDWSDAARTVQTD